MTQRPRMATVRAGRCKVWRGGDEMSTGAATAQADRASDTQQTHDRHPGDCHSEREDHGLLLSGFSLLPGVASFYRDTISTVLSLVQATRIAPVRSVGKAV